MTDQTVKSDQDDRMRKIRKRVAQECGLPEPPEVLWNALVEEGYVEDALSRDRGMQDLLKAVRRWVPVVRSLQTGRTRNIGRTKPPVRADHLFTEYELERSRVLSGYLIRAAASIPRIRRLFERLNIPALDGDAQAALARQLIGSPATRWLSFDDFERAGVRIAEHRAEVLDECVKGGREFRVLELHPGGTRIEATGPWEVVKVGQASIRLPAYQPASSAPKPTPEIHTLRARPPGQAEAMVVPVWTGSVLDSIRVDALWLHDRFGWPEDETVWFLLTGEPPIVWPIDEEIRGSSPFGPRTTVVQLTVQPWVTAESLARYYRRVQRTLGVIGSTKPVATRTLRMFEFASAERLVNPRATWAKLLSQWNRENPTETYGSPQRMHAAYKTVERTLQLPPVEMFTQAAVKRGRQRATEGKDRNG
jgi:hypothetical protein